MHTFRKRINRLNRFPIPDLIMALAREAEGERDKISASDNDRVFPLEAARRSLALDNSVSKATTFDDSSSTSPL